MKRRVKHATPRLFVEGSLAFDRIFAFPGKFSDHLNPKKLHVLSVSFSVHEMKEQFGGTAGNIAYSLGLLGHRPVLLSKAGNDFRAYQRWLNAHGVDTARVERRSTLPSATALIFTDRMDNQITGFYKGAMQHPLKKRFPAMTARDIVIIAPGNKTDMLSLGCHAARHRVPYIFDPGQALPAFTKRELRFLVRHAGIVVVNDYELAQLRRQAGFTRGDILRHGRLLITTFGPRGSEFATAEKRIRIPAVKVRSPKDPTGAGDAFRAGLIHGILCGFPLEKTGRLAATVAAYAVEHHGTQEHRFTLSAVKKRYHMNFSHAL